MKTIKWESERCFIPGYGEAVKGAEIILPDDQANSFVNRKMATHASSGEKLKSIKIKGVE